MSRHRAGTAVIEKGRKSVDEILDAASALLAEAGYAELSTRKVATRAGMLPGNLQYYFPAKRGLVRALLERYLKRSLERLAARVGGGEPSPEGQLRQIIEGILADQSSTLDCAMFREIWALAVHDPEVAKALDDFYDEYRAHMGAILRSVNPRLQKAGSERLATTVIAMLEGLSILRKPAKPDSVPTDDYCFEVILRLTQGVGG